MKLSFLTIFAFSVAILTSQAASVENSPQTNSLISSFSGPHNGTLIVTSNSVSLLGATTGNFQASRKKEIGTLNLTSAVSLNGSAFIINEQYQFKKKKVTYTFGEILNGSPVISGTGTGRAKIRKNLITYSAVFSVPGQTLFVQGKIKLAKNNHLTITENISGILNFTYQLNGKKKKH